MGQFFSDKTEEGIRLCWMQFDSGEAQRGRQLLEQAAQEGEADAYSFLAHTYLGVNGLEEDMDKAFALLRKSAELGSSCGILTMMQFKMLTNEVMKKIDIAKRKAAEAEVRAKADGGHALCRLIMGMYYLWGGYWISNELDAEKEYGGEDEALEARLTEAAPWFEKALYGGITAGLNNLCNIYKVYHDNEEKLEKAMRFAAELGDPYWRVRLANRLFDEERYEEALGLFEQLAQDGYARAWYDAGFQYERGIGTEADGEKAIAAYEQGAKLGSATCQTRLGKQLLWGKIAPKDEAKAYFWLCKAAEQGDEIAKMWKGHCMLYGMGVPKDEDEGTTLLINALNYNYPDEGESQSMADDSQFDWDEDMLQMFWDLGDAYENGHGMPKREASAGYYYNMVARGGWPEAIEKMTHYEYGGFLKKKWKRIK